MMLIALLRVEAVGDDHLRRRVDRRLRIVALDEAVLGFHDAAFGIGEVLCALGSGSSDGGAAGLPGFLRPSACRRSSASACALALAAAAAFASASNWAFAARISRRALLVGVPIWAVPRRSCRGRRLMSSLGVRSLGCAQPPLDLGLELRCTLLHALVAHRLVLGGVRLDLRPVERDMAELHKSRLFAQLENLPERSPASAFKCRLRKSETVRIRRIEPDNAHEVDPFARRLGDPARRVDAVTIAVQQQRRHHRRVKRRLPALARIRGFDLTKVEMLSTSAKMKRARWSSEK